jgi:iron-containing alcohol dehydrogenase-like protein
MFPRGGPRASIPWLRFDMNDTGSNMGWNMNDTGWNRQSGLLAAPSFRTTIVFGCGAVHRLPVELKKRNVSRPLLVMDAGFVRTSGFERVSKLVPAAAVFSKVDPNPTGQNVLDGVEAYRENGCDGVIALGGGSPLDAGKAIRLKTTHEGILAQYDDLPPTSRKKLPGPLHIPPVFVSKSVNHHLLFKGRPHNHDQRNPQRERTANKPIRRQQEKRDR